MGDGKGGLTPMSGAHSGIDVYGDQRGAAYADFDHDGRLDLVVSQNGATTRLFHNRGAKPGLRVRVVGPPANPDAVGAQIRVVYGDRMGPVREIQAGSGYWSQNGATQVIRSLRNAHRDLGPLARRRRDANGGSGWRKRSHHQALIRSTGPPVPTSSAKQKPSRHRHCSPAFARGSAYFG